MNHPIFILIGEIKYILLTEEITEFRFFRGENEATKT